MPRHSSPRSAAGAVGIVRVEQPGRLRRREHGIDGEPAQRTRSPAPSRRSRAQCGAVRRSCQLSSGPTACPMRRSHSTSDSRCVLRPTAATAAASCGPGSRPRPRARCPRSPPPTARPSLVGGATGRRGRGASDDLPVGIDEHRFRGACALIDREQHRITRSGPGPRVQRGRCRPVATKWSANGLPWARTRRGCRGSASAPAGARRRWRRPPPSPPLTVASSAVMMARVSLAASSTARSSSGSTNAVLITRAPIRPGGAVGGLERARDHRADGDDRHVVALGEPDARGRRERGAVGGDVGDLEARDAHVHRAGARRCPSHRSARLGAVGGNDDLQVGDRARPGEVLDRNGRSAGAP